MSSRECGPVVSWGCDCADCHDRYRYKNRFAFLGNGDIKATVTKDVQGLSVYMRDSDHEWHVE